MGHALKLSLLGCLACQDLAYLVVAAKELDVDVESLARELCIRARWI